MKKQSIALLSALTIGSLSLSAQTAPAPAPAAPSVAVTVTPSFVSQYMFRGQRLGGLSFQPIVEATYGNFGLGVWSNFPINDKVPGVSDPEIDPYGYYTINISDSLSIVPGFTLYTYTNAATNNGFYRSTFEPSVALNYTIGGVKLTPKLYYDFTLEGPTLELTAFYAVPLKEIGTELDFTGIYGTYIWDEFAKDSIPSTKAWGDYWSIGVSLPFQLSKESKLVVGYAYTKGDSAYVKVGKGPKSSNTTAVGRGVISVSYSYSF